MIRYQKKKEGLLGRSWIIQPAPLDDGVILDCMSLSDLPSGPSRVYVEVPAGHALVHKDSPFDAFYVCTAIDNRYMTDMSKVQVSPIYATRETTGHKAIQCGMGFDIEVQCPDYPMPVPARIAIFFTYTPRIVQHAKLVTALHDRAPLNKEELENILQERVRDIFREAFMGVIGNSTLTQEQINGVVSGEEGREAREKVLDGMRQLGSEYGLAFDCGSFTRGEIFDRPGSNAWTKHSVSNERKLDHAISIRAMTDDTNYIKAINENKRALETSDRELDESRENQ